MHQICHIVGLKTQLTNTIIIEFIRAGDNWGWFREKLAPFTSTEMNLSVSALSNLLFI